MDPSRVVPGERRPSETRSEAVITLNEADLNRWAVISSIQTSLSELKTNVDIIDEDLSELHVSRPPHSVRFALMQTRKHIAGVADNLALLVDQIPLQARPTVASAIKAQQVFGIPELLEQILMHCNKGDLVTARGVARIFASTISKSIKIQESLGLRPATGGTPFSPFADKYFVLRGFVVRLEKVGRHVLDSSTVELTATLNTINLMREVNLPTVGSFWRRMLVSQPPIKSMRIRTNCCDQGFGPEPLNHHDSAQRGPEIRSSTGITLGDILDATQRLREEHRLCPSAFSGLHRVDGTVDVAVVFESSIRLQANDPLLRLRQRALAEHQRDQQCLAARQAKINAYVMGKQRAREEGRPIPTLQEFEADGGVLPHQDQGSVAIS